MKKSCLLTLLLALMTTTVLTAAEALTDVGKQQLEADWLMQCGDKPTHEAAASECARAKYLAHRIKLLKNAPNLDADLKKLTDLEKKAVAKQGDAKELYLAVRRVKRDIAFKNPLIDFDKVILIDNPYPNGKRGDATNEWDHEARHRNGYMAEYGGRLLVTGLNPGGKEKDLFENFEGKGGSFWRPDVHFSGEKVLVSYQPPGEKSFHIYEVDKDGKQVKQLTYGDYSDLDPVYTPDGKITFCTERSHTYVRCMPMTHAYAVARCDGDGKNIYVVSRNGEAEYMPSVLNDGRVIYTRWEYTEKALWRIQSLWTMNPDGTNVQIFWGNQSRWPDVLTEARAIPGSRRVMFNGVGHHQWFEGSIGIIDPDKGLDHPDGLSKVTQQVRWPEVGDGNPRCEQETDKYADDYATFLEKNNVKTNLPIYQVSNAAFGAYKTPYPLSEEFFLASAKRGGKSRHDRANLFGLYLVDVFGNHELIHKGQYNSYYAMPMCKRPTPPAIPDRVKWPKIGSNEKPANGILYSNDVFANAPEGLREKGKYIRVMQMDPKNYTTWHKTVQHDGPAVSVFQADGVKRILGTIPIEKDGSIAMEVPPGEAIYFQMLDAKKQAIHVMRSFTGVMPGEVRGCFGCHESKLKTRGNLPLPNQSIAMKKGPQKPTEPSWGYDTSISYLRFVQPVLDKHCGKCHQKEGSDAFKKLNMTLRPSAHRWRSNVNSRPNESSPFTEPYLTLVGGGQGWGRGGKKMPISGVYVVEDYNSGSGTATDVKTLPPYSAFSPKSMLIEKATSGKHGKGVKVTGEDLERLVAWVDSNGPYLGDEEIREMYDPYTRTVETIPAVRPRIATAPRINRFNIRQDGDSNAVAGVPLKIFEGVSLITPRAGGSAKESKAITDAKKEKNVKIEIKKAQYGAGDKWVDVTKQVAAKAKACRYIELGQYNALAGDPINGTVKTLKIEYLLNGKPGKAVFAENSPVLLPAEKK